MRTIRSSFRFALVMLLSGAALALAQESVDVPRQLRADVQAFTLTVDSLKSLTAGMRERTRVLLRQLQILRQKLALQEKGSNAYRVYRREYEVKLAQYLADKFAALEGVRRLRLQTLAALERILEQLKDEDDGAANALNARIKEQLRRNEDRITQAKLEMLRLLNSLQRSDLSESERLALSRQYHRLQNDRVALYQQQKTRFSDLLTAAATENSELPAVRNALTNIRQTLRHSFDWIDLEMSYIELYAAHRQRWLKTDGKLVEINGLIERFGSAVEAMNASSALLRDVEQFDRGVVADQNVQTLLPSIPVLQWPGRPAGVQPDIALSPAQSDSLRRELEKQLQPKKLN